VTYDEAIDWLLSFADFERSGRFQDRPDVAPMLALLERLGNPHLGRATAHIAGSKGKGSVAAMVESVLRAAGFGTGLYTSPHLHDYTERIKIDGEALRQTTFARLATQFQPAVEEAEDLVGNRELVTFDILTALGFMAFRDADVAAQVVEVGLGGRVDSTNVFESKEVAVISPISLEHTAILGDTIEEIAREKAAIITPGATVVIAPQPYHEAERVIQEFARANVCSLIEVATHYQWKRRSHNARGQRIQIKSKQGVIEVDLPLLGAHQVENAATATASVRAFDHEVSTVTIADGLASVRWPCRIEVLREDPLVIVDGAHNRDSARRLAETLVEYFACDRALFVIGCGSDKDIDGLAEELAPLASRVLAVRSQHPRAMEPQRIAEAFGRLNVDVEIVHNVPNGVERALATTSEGALTLICVTGSLFVAAEARGHLLGLRT
jgi:dihydrofolate synthase/folylpolyglutamate synthase